MEGEIDLALVSAIGFETGVVEALRGTELLPTIPLNGFAF
jgi:hypothetical protein